MLRAARFVLTTLNVLNWLCAAAFIVLVVWITVEPAMTVARFGVRAAPITTLGQVTSVFGTGAAVAAHVIFTRLVGIIDSVAAGQPFSAANARRLNAIAWALLATQVLDLGFGLLAGWYGARTGQALPWSVGLTGWLAVLMLFVLARVFAQGAAMQDEIEATV